MSTERHERRSSRIRKRLTVRFGADELSTTGFTRDVSLGGLFLLSKKLVPIRTQLHLHVTWPTGSFYIEGVVVRHEAAHPEVHKVQEVGMGIRFMEPHEVVESVVPRVLRSGAELVLDCASAEELRELQAEQVLRGVLFVPVSEPRPVVGQQVEFTIVLVYKRRDARAMGTGQVVQVLERGMGKYAQRPGAVIALEDPAELIRQLYAANKIG